MVHVLYFATLREQRGADRDTLDTTARTPRELLDELVARHTLRVDRASLVVAVNDELSTWNTPLADGDTVVFLPPVSGG